MLTVALLSWAGCDSPPSDEGSPVHISYQIGGERDLYEDGDRYGHKITIRFNRTYTLHQLTYRETDGGRRLEEALVRRDTLRQTIFDQLQSDVDTLSTDAFPEVLPTVNPRTVPFRTPALSVVLATRQGPTAAMDTIQANMGADRTHYPSAFLQLHDRLGALVRSMSSDTSSSS